MRIAWQEVWRSALTMAKIFGTFFGAWLLVGLFWPLSLTNWDWGLTLLASVALAGFLRSWKKTSLLGTLLGVLCVVLLLVLIVSASTWRLEPGAVWELPWLILYASVACAVVTAMGFYIGRFFFARRSPPHS